MSEQNIIKPVEYKVTYTNHSPEGGQIILMQEKKHLKLKYY